VQRHRTKIARYAHLGGVSASVKSGGWF